MDGNASDDHSLSSIVNSMPFRSNVTSHIVSDDSRNEFWGLSDRDVPILIGAAAGAVGLVFLILGAVLIWLCCQFTLRREKSVYSLDNESEGGSVSSQGSQQYNSESVIFMGIKSANGEANNNTNIKRSISAPLHASVQNGFDANGKSISTRKQIAREMKPFTSVTQYAYTNMSQDFETVAETDADEERRRRPYRSNSRRHLYTASDTKDSFDSLRTRSLPWRHSKRVFAEAEDIEDLGSSTTIVNFSKKRKNRMRNDSAAAIAMNLSGESPAKMPFLHKDTDSLVDNEAVVVYDERTAL